MFSVWTMISPDYKSIFAVPAIKIDSAVNKNVISHTSLTEANQ